MQNADYHFSLPRPTDQSKGGKGAMRSREGHESDPFPSLPPTGRQSFPSYQLNFPGYQPQSPQLPTMSPPAPPPIPVSQGVIRPGIGGGSPQNGNPKSSAWSSPRFASRSQQRPVPTLSPDSDSRVPNSTPGADSPRSFHEKMRIFTGIGAEAYRSAFGLPEDRGIAWEMHCMRERVLATSRSSSSPVRVPEIVQHKYHSLLVLDSVDSQSPTATNMSKVLGYRTCAYKALSTTDPFVYCLRRVDGFRLSNFDLVQDAIERWSEIKHPNIVAVRQAFATSEFQDLEGHGEGGSLVYVYDYIDLAQSMEAWHDASGNKPVHETVLWDVIVQVSLALRLIHSRDLVMRCMHPSKLLISSRFRVHLNCVGLMDAVHHQSLGGEDRQSSALNDLEAFGRIVVMLGLGKKWEAVEHEPTESLLEEVRTNGTISPAIIKVIEELFSKQGSANRLVELSAPYIAYKAEQLESTQDVLVGEIRKFLDVSRMQKMLVKICAISDRVHLLEDWRWASTGDRYLVQLFRDYVFYQNDESGRPFLDLGHVADCLAKVDTGSFEPVMLMNRDGSTVLVTNYNEIRRCIESSFKEIADASRPRHLI